MGIKLHAGWGWDCPSCSHRNFAFGDYDVGEDIRDKVQAHCDENDSAGQIVVVPEEVTCAKCLNTFDADMPENWMSSEDPA